MSQNISRFKVVSLFTGCGGFDLGLKKAGFNVIWANDFFKEAVDTYKSNIGDHVHFGDITKVKNDEIPNNFDVLIGGFPCQGFSVANTKRSMTDSRNFLYLELLRVLKAKAPTYFIAENVKGILSMEKGKVFDMIIKDFTDLGYRVDYRLLNAAEYGIPQFRERIFIIGNRINAINPFPVKTHSVQQDSSLFNILKPVKTVKESIGFLANVRTRDFPFELNGEMIHNHVARLNVSEHFFGRKFDVNQFDICDYLKHWRSKSDLSVKKIDQIFGYAHTAGHWFRKDNNSGSIPKPDDWWELKKLLKFDDKYDEQVTTFVKKNIAFEQSLRINNWETPSDTITATGPEIHPNKLRRLSVRECAIIQTFPNDFIFKGSIGNMYKQIGNAVPVDLAYKIAELIKKELIKHESNRITDNREIRAKVS